ncbi:2-oxoglutarate-dependent dioxygenase [Apiospora phragmitis]|uniref:2-oxoglutarate-dependent dioxygenase n=1 Tax=Apiospora phragmitis TaxID=2905665 RepID=A0ABR1WRP5_9PEZI
MANEHAADLSSTSSMTFLKYTEQGEVKAEGGHVPHTDIWVQPRPGCLVVNVGDSLRLLSGRKLKSSLRRAIPHANAVGRARHSFAYLLRPSETALLDLGDGRVCTSLDWHFKKLDVFQAPPDVQAENLAVLLGKFDGVQN